MLNILKGKKLFEFSLEQSARLSRFDKKGILILPLMRLLGWMNGSVRKVRRQNDAAGIAREWQRMFPGSARHFPIIEENEDTAVAEIRLRCPLRDSGDVHACYRMMEYDRKMVSDMGGQFVVLDSQSNNGKGVCRVAFRKNGADMSDLIEAHRKTE